MKKLLILSLIAIFLFSFVACDEKVEIPETGTEQEGQTPTPPSGDQGGEETPPSGDQGGEVTPPSGGETSDLIRGVDESLYSTVWKGTSDSGIEYLLIFDDKGRLSISVDYGSYYVILPLLEDIEEFANLQFPSLIYYQNGENPGIFPSDNTILEEFTRPNSLSSRFSISTDTFNLDYDIEVSKIDDSLSVNSSGIFTTLEDSTQYSLLMARLTDLFEFPIFTDQVFEKITLDNFIYGTYSIVDEEKAIFRAELKELVIPSQMIVVATETFHDLPLLENIIISEGVSELKSYSIYALPRVKTVEIPASVEYIGPGCFCQCPSLTSINVSEDNLSYKSIDGVLYSKDGYTLVAYPEGKGANITIKDVIETIGASSFQDNLTITELTIPTSVISIEPNAFMYTSNLEIINYDGTMQEWNDIIKGEDWNWQSTFTVKCTDGNIDYQNEEIQE